VKVDRLKILEYLKDQGKAIKQTDLLDHLINEFSLQERQARYILRNLLDMKILEHPRKEISINKRIINFEIERIKNAQKD